MTAHADNSVDNWFRDRLKWSEPNLKIAARASDILQMGLTYAPVTFAITDDRSTKEVLGVAAAQLTAAGVTQGTKHLTKRWRPNGDNNLAFPSGHSTAAWAGATALCGLDNDACGPAYLAAAATSYLRVAADKHWMSDVVVGAGVGYAAGRQIPKLIIGGSW